MHSVPQEIQETLGQVGLEYGAMTHGHLRGFFFQLIVMSTQFVMQMKIFFLY